MGTGYVAQSQALECRTHLGDLSDLRQVKRGDPHASAWLTDGKTLCLETSEGLVDRYMARAELHGDMVLAQARARLQLAGYDPVGEGSGDLCGAGISMGHAL